MQNAEAQKRRTSVHPKCRREDNLQLQSWIPSDTLWGEGSWPQSIHDGAAWEGKGSHQLFDWCNLSSVGVLVGVGRLDVKLVLLYMVISWPSRL